MLFNDRVLFIHVPKTAGISVTKFLIDNIPGQFTITLPRGHRSPSPRALAIEGRRHEKLSEAARALEKRGRALSDFEAIIAVMRNPYDLEVSYYHYKRLGHKYDAGLAQRLAMEGNFLEFARNAPYYGCLPSRIQDWYQIDGKIPDQLTLVRYESLREDLFRVVSRICTIKQDLEKENATTHEPYERYLTAEVEKAIYKKYRWLFDQKYYARAAFSSVNVSAAGHQVATETALDRFWKGDPGTGARSELALTHLIETLNCDAEIDAATAQRVLRIAFNVVNETLADRKRLVIPHLGTFVRTTKKAQRGAAFSFLPWSDDNDGGDAPVSKGDQPAST